MAEEKEINLPEISEMVSQDDRITAHPETVAEIIKVAFEKVAQQAWAGNRIEIYHFGTFRFKRRKAYSIIGIDGKPHDLPAVDVLKFKASQHQEYPVVE